jgi:outer membrane immunogenic protein
LVYLAAGTAEVEIAGLGAAYAVSPQTIVSVELLEHEFSNIGGSGIDADAWSVSLRASWKF